MKVIDLLVKIANEEEVPQKIKYENDIYIHIDNYCYYCEDTNLILSDRIFAEYNRLNDYIEIIEDKPKKIEKIQLENRDDSKIFQYSMIPNYEKVDEVIQICNENFGKHQEIIYMLVDTLNEVINKLNYLLEKSDKDECK